MYNLIYNKGDINMYEILRDSIKKYFHIWNNKCEKIKDVNNFYGKQIDTVLKKI